MDANIINRALNSASRRFGWTLSALAVLSVSSQAWCPQLTWVFFVLTAGASLAGLCRLLCGDAYLTRTAVISFGARVLATLALFFISYYRLPVLRRVQLGGGFWSIGGDGVGYHTFALRILDAWKQGLDLPFMFRDGVVDFGLYRDLSLPIAFLYKLVGASLLHALLFNAFIGALAAVPAYLFVRKLADVRGARFVATLVAFWPSSIIWSTQLLRDSASLLAILTIFYCVASIWRLPANRSARGGRLITLCHWAGLFASVGMLTYCRFYMSYFLWGCISAVFGIACVKNLISREWIRAVRAVALVMLMGVAAFTARSIDFLTLFSPPHAEVVHVQRAVQQLGKGDIEHAILSSWRAFELNPSYKPNLQVIQTLHEMVDRAGGRQSLAFNYHIADLLTIMMDHYHFPALNPGDNPKQAVGSGIAVPEENPSRSQESGAGSSGAPSSEALVAPLPNIIEPTEPASIAATAAQEQASAPKGAQVRRPWPLPKLVLNVVNKKSLSDARRFWDWGLLKYLNNSRIGMNTTLGHSSVDSDVQFRSIGDVIKYLPKALSLAFFSPFPWEWFDTTGETGGFRVLSLFEMVLMYGLFFPIIISTWRLVRSNEAVRLSLVVYSWSTAIVLSLMITNIGTLFRLRLQYLMPMLLMLGLSRPPYEALFNRFLKFIGAGRIKSRYWFSGALIERVQRWYLSRQVDMLSPWISPGTAVLDFGCGDGGLAAGLMERVNGAVVTGVDVVDSSNRAAQVPFQAYDGDQLPFAEKSFDLVMAYHVLHHCALPEAALSECCRVSGKRVLIVEPTVRGWWDLPAMRLSDWLFNAWKPEPVPMPYNFRRRENWRQLFSEFGYAIEHESVAAVFPWWLPLGRTLLIVAKRAVSAGTNSNRPGAIEERVSCDA